MKILISFFLGIFTLIMAHAQNFEGTWKGKIEQFQMEIIFHIKNTPNGIEATMDIPAQGASGMLLDKAVATGKEIELGFSQAQMKVKGTLKDEETIAGTLIQAGAELPIELKKSTKLPGDNSLPYSEEQLRMLASYGKGDYVYSVENYFSKPKASSFQISPNGKNISYKEKDNNLKNHVYIKNIQTGKITRVIEEKEEIIRGYGWANDTRLVYVMDQGGNEDYHLFAVDINGKNFKELTPFKGVTVDILESLKEDKNHMIISMNKENKSIFEPYKINLITGELKKLYTNDDPKNPIIGYSFDKDGNLRGFVRLKDGVNSVLYYAKEKGKYEIIKEFSWKDSFSIISYNYASKNPHEAYVTSNLEGDKTKIYLYDMKKDKKIKELFKHDEFDTQGLSLSKKRNWELDYFIYEGEKSVIVPKSNYYKKLHKKITNKFPNYDYSIVDHDDDENTYLISIGSDRLYGKYYTLNAKTGEFKMLFDLMPQLKEEDMAPMLPIKFKSRDGLTIHGYITLPKSYKKGNKVPLIVNPHGGPQGVRDSWGFNPEAQLFASRGFATLQVNFRISGGYGKKFLEAGFKQVGRKCMDDVEDGIQYVINQGYIDKSKIAIYGASHGGYAVLRGMIKTPELYACGVDYVGVSNLFTFMKTIPPYWKPYLKIIKEIWYDEEVPEELKIMKEVSPIYKVDKITKPLFVVQGANDPRVNIDESDQIVSALRKRNFEVPYMVKYDEGHGFSHEKNRIALYKAMLGFFAKHLN